MNAIPPCILFEDDHLLVVNKPAGMNTHSPDVHAGEGIYEWLRGREVRWANLAIIHRLDKSTSGVMVFGKTKDANQSLTAQFSTHKIEKRYILATDRAVKFAEETVRSTLVRIGERYESRSAGKGGDIAETHFKKLSAKGNLAILEAIPLTGKTHQIRSHAASLNIPLLGDTLYGGTASARVHLHAEELTLAHPVSNERLSFKVAADFSLDVHQQLRAAVVVPQETNAYRLIHGASDRQRGLYLERLGDFLYVQTSQPLTDVQLGLISSTKEYFASSGVYQKKLIKSVGNAPVEDVSPNPVLGEAAGGSFAVLENGVHYEMSFEEGYSVGLFLDQRDNRRRLLKNHVGAEFPVFSNAPADSSVLNTFAYTCGFSVCAALAGARTTSLDLSKKYLEWGKRNFALNKIDCSSHDFIFGDAFDWLRRLHKKGRSFDVVILDPPTSSQSKETGRFSAEKDYGRLMDIALPLLQPGGTILASTNAAKFLPVDFVEMVNAAIHRTGRKILLEQYAPQPPDFPVTRDEPAYLKTLWVKVK